MLNAKKQIAITRVKVVWAKPINANETALIPQAAANGFRLSKRETSQPEMGRPISELTGMAKRSVPNSASLKSKNVLIVGIREAQVEKLKPEIKKNMLRKRRLRFGKIIIGSASANIFF